MVITTDTENIFDKNPISIPNLNLHNVVTKGNFLNMINGIKNSQKQKQNKQTNKKTVSNTHNGERLNCIP